MLATKSTAGEIAHFGGCASNDAITVLKALQPSRVCKTFKITDGALTKQAVCNVTHAQAVTHTVETAQELASLLKTVTEANDLVLVPGSWINGDLPFEVITEKMLAQLMDSTAGEVAGGVHEIDDHRVAARLKRGMRPSAWVLIDADNPEGMPDDWKALDLGARLRMLEPILPGISTCERVELRSSSARVSNTGTFGGPSHAYIRVSEPSKIDVLRAYLNVQMVLLGISFQSPRYSRVVPGTIIGYGQRTVIDSAVWVPGRLVFCSRPDVCEAPGYSVGSADIHIVNEGGGPLDISFIEAPTAKQLATYGTHTGVRVRIGKEDGGLHFADYGQLTADTEITVGEVVKSFSDWVQGMKPGEKLRCEAPFRASVSEAAFIRKLETGEGFVYDIGTGTTHYLVGAKRSWTYDEALAEARCLTRDDTDGIGELAQVASRLSPVERETVFNAIKAATGTTLTTLRDQASSAIDADRDDHLSLALKTLALIGPKNIIFVNDMFWKWDDAGVWKPGQSRLA